MNQPDPAVLALCRYHREADPERLVLRLCRRLLAQCPTASGPTPLQVLGSLQGVRRYDSRPIHPSAGCSGLLVPRDGGYDITVHVGEPKERQNFSVAHEIVHTFFREASPYAQPSLQEEKLCDLGAAELTMPSARFSAFLAAKGLSLAGIGECRTEFAVSFEAAGRRSISLTDEPACLLIATMSRTKKQKHFDVGEPVLRITKWWQSQTWPDGNNYQNLAVDPASLIGQAFTNQDQRHGRASLGIAFRPGIYELETRGYAYPLPGNPGHRQVVTLAHVPN